jgi:3-oxoacyl-ACP reductase-like protein
MSIFGSIVSAIFGPSSSQTSAAPAAAETPADQSASAASPAADTPAAEIPVAQSAPAAAPAGEPVDVAAIMDNLASQAAQKLDWRNSIVDLMKLINLDSSLVARKELAQELNYTGDMNDSASMNIWLHKEVMTKLAENGGKVPDELKH